MFKYEDFISRNYLFIDNKLQQSIKKIKLGFAGVGLASMMAEMAVRVGFENFILSDSDHVETSNLNRQNYVASDVGNAKLLSLKNRLLSINPEIHIELMEKGIKNNSDINYIVDKSDILINTIDFGEEYFKLVETACQYNKLIICLFNPGFGGLAVCFKYGTGSLYDLLKTNKIEYGLEFSKKLILSNEAIQIGQEMRNNLDSLLSQIQVSGYEPQLVIGTCMSSAIGLNCIIKYINHETIPYCPQVIFKGFYM
ncbi:MAG: ThiF family adenylyltransferase [Gammaproteobacteria bacterium]